MNTQLIFTTLIGFTFGILVFTIVIPLMRAILKNRKNRKLQKKNAEVVVEDVVVQERQRKVKKKKPLEFSKKLIMVLVGMSIIIIIYAMFIIYLMVTGDYMGDPISLNSLILAVSGEVGIASSFYYWKSRRENEIKLKKMYGEDYTKENEHDNY